MADILVNEWVEEYEALTESEIGTYAMEQDNNQEVKIAVYNILEESLAQDKQEVSYI